MKIKMLGTAACEGIPAMFCNCEHCVQARKLKGKKMEELAGEFGFVVSYDGIEKEV